VGELEGVEEVGLPLGTELLGLDVGEATENKGDS